MTAMKTVRQKLNRPKKAMKVPTRPRRSLQTIPMSPLPEAAQPELLEVCGSESASQPSAFFTIAFVPSSDVFATFSGSCFQYSRLKSSIESAPR